MIEATRQILAALGITEDQYEMLKRAYDFEIGGAVKEPCTISVQRDGAARNSKWQKLVERGYVVQKDSGTDYANYYELTQRARYAMTAIDLVETSSHLHAPPGE